MASQFGSFPAPNYDDPVTRGHSLTIVSSILIFVAAVAVGLRYLSHYLHKRFGLDDVCIFLAWLFALVLIILDAIVTTKYGWNRHVWDVPYNWFALVGLYSWIARIVWCVAGCCTRLSILSFYYTLIQGATWTRNYRRVLHGAVAGVVVLFLITLFTGVFLCTPASAYWAVPRGKCRSEARELFATSVASGVCDAILVTLPIPMIWKLQMSTRKRVQAICLLAVGSIATIASAIRAYYVWHLFHASADQSWNAFPIYFLSDLEIVLGIICACAPHIKPLFTKRSKNLTPRGILDEEKTPKHEARDTGDVESLTFITIPTGPSA